MGRKREVTLEREGIDHACMLIKLKYFRGTDKEIYYSVDNDIYIVVSLILYI